MFAQGQILQRSILVGCLFLGMSCRYSGPYVDSVEEVTLTYSADPSTAVYTADGGPGQYRLKRFEGRARAVLAGGASFGLQTEPERSSQPVVQPFSGSRIALERLPDGRVRMLHGEGQKSTLKFVTGSWREFDAGRDVVLRFEEASWQAWAQASQKAMLAIIDRYRDRVIPKLARGQELSDARVVDVLVDEKPLVRANRAGLMVFFEALRLEGGFAVTTRQKHPRYSWWAYELRPAVSDVFATIGVTIVEATVFVALASLECCGHLAGHCR